MSKYLIALAIAGAMTVPAGAQTMPANPSVNQAQQASPPMVKKTVCEDNDNPFSNIHRICRTVMVPAKPAGPATAKQAPQPNEPQGSGN